jgi:acetyl esterase
MNINLKIKILLLLNKFTRKINLKTVSAKELRLNSKRLKTKYSKFFEYPKEEILSIENKVLNFNTYNEVKVRIYKSIDGKNQAVIMYFHGGGFVIGNLESHDSTCRRLAKQNSCIVVSVDYRLAPEHQFPAAIEDCYNASCWIYNNAETIGADKNKLIVMGDSAGGNLATVITMMARDKGYPLISYQILIYPLLDVTLSMNSINSLSKGYILTKDLLSWFMLNYCGNIKDLKQAYLSPLFSNNLNNLPPALIITGEYDPLKDEGRAYAKKLKYAGNKVTFKEYKGMIHIFFQMPKYLKPARDLEKQISNILTHIIKADLKSN